MPPKAVVPPARSRPWRVNPLPCMLCVVISLVVLFTIVILVVGIVGAIKRDSHDSSHTHATATVYDDDDDDGVSALNYHHMQHDKRRITPELNTLEAIDEVLGDDDGYAPALTDDGWLPRGNAARRKSRATLDSLDPFEEHVKLAARRSAHILDLRGHKRIGDDTFYLGAHPHPHDSSLTLHSSAFVHKATQKDAPLPSRSALSKIERTAKKRHFNRTTEDVLVHHQRKRQVIECGAPIAVGAKMKNVAGYYVHPLNGGGFDTQRVIEQTELAMDAWRGVFRSIHLEPVGALLGVFMDEDEDAAIEFDKPTGENHVAFARLRLPDGEEDSTLAITVTRGVYGGARHKRYISEFATLFNDGHYTFADCEDVNTDCRATGAIDYQAIATHELGHAHGLDDLYSSECVDSTMYWSARPGETNKRSLEEDDKLSMIALYTQ